MQAILIAAVSAKREAQVDLAQPSCSRRGLGALSRFWLMVDAAALADRVAADAC